MSSIHALPISLSLVGASSTLVAVEKSWPAIATGTRTGGLTERLIQNQSFVGRLTPSPIASTYSRAFPFTPVGQDADSSHIF